MLEGESKLTKIFDFKEEKEETYEIVLKKIKIESNIQDEKIKVKIPKIDSKIKLEELNDVAKFKTCQFCKILFSSRECLVRHMKKVHSNEVGSLNCPICKLKFLPDKKKRLEIHMRKKHPNGQPYEFECDICGKILNFKKNFKSHMNKHKLSIVKCKICDKILKSSSLKDHIQKFHGQKQKCEICLKDYKDLRNHIKIHNKKFQCEVCKKFYPNASNLRHHIKFFHKNTKNFECEICNKVFRMKSQLKEHQKVHDKNRLKPFECLRCDFKTDRKMYLDAHQKSHQRIDEKYAAMENPIKCSKCPAFFEDEERFNRHLKNVHPQKLFQCDLCAKFINNRGNLYNHVLTVHISKV